MKKLVVFIFIFCGCTTYAQTQRAEEKTLREAANFASFLADVKKNPRTDCLCNNNEYNVFSFRTKAGKIASLCVSKQLMVSAGYLVYRFGTKNKLELTFPSDTLNSLSQFSFAHYNRGGGKQNAAMYVNSLRFINGDYTYTLHDDWNSENNQYAKGIIITNNKTGKSTSVDAKGKVSGSLFVFSNNIIVKETDEL